MLRKKIMIILMLLVALSSFAEERYTSLLLGNVDGTVYYEENADEMHPLASITKMVNLMVVFDKLEAGEIEMTDMVSISEEARNIKGSRVWMGKGAKVSVEDLIKATAVHSANNAAYALAEYASGGNVDNHIELMNEKVKEVGAVKEVEFYTPTGLPPYMTGEEMDRGTARGIYLLSIEALNYPEYIKIASSKEVVIQGSQKIKNRNKLLSEKDGIYGIKTGNHKAAGFNITLVSTRRDVDVITVVFGAETEDIRNEVAKETIDGFYREYQVRQIVDKDVPLEELKIEKGVEDFIVVYPERSIEAFVSDTWEVVIEKEYNKRVIAPIEIGDVLGEYKVLVEGEVIDAGKIYSDRDVPKENVFKELMKDIF